MQRRISPGCAEMSLEKGSPTHEKLGTPFARAQCSSAMAQAKEKHVGVAMNVAGKRLPVGLLVGGMLLVAGFNPALAEVIGSGNRDRRANKRTARLRGLLPAASAGMPALWVTVCQAAHARKLERTRAHQSPGEL